MSDIDTMLAEVKRLDAEATRKPWNAGLGCVYENDGFSAGDPNAPDTRIAQANDKDSELIAYYRTAAPALAAEVERLRAEVERHKAAASAVREEALDDAATAIKEAEDKLYPHARGPYLECRKIIATIRSRSAAGGQGGGE